MLVDHVPGLLRRARRRSNLSQRELASLAGVSATTVAHIESGRHVPSLRVLECLLDAGGLTLAVLDGSGSPVDPYDGDGLRDRVRRHFPAYAEMREVGPNGEGWWGSETVMPWIRQRPTHTFDRYRP
jgi:transcriptional regulator with XRE-family HTH domain